MTKSTDTKPPATSALPRRTGSHPRVREALSDWMINDTEGLTFGTDAQKAACWQKAASRLEKLARQLESETNENTDRLKHTINL